MEGKKRRTKNPLDAKKVFPCRLTKLMKEHKITQTALAERLGVTRQAVANYCDGSSTPSWEGIAEIARFFNCSSDYLLGLSEYRSHVTEDITLAQLGLNEATIKNLQKHCKPPAPGFRVYSTRNARSGINLLLGNNLIWDRRLFQEISRLRKIVYIYEEKSREDLFDKELRAHFQELEIGDMNEDELFSPINYVDYRIARLGSWFTDCVKKVTGYNKIYEKVFGNWDDETEESPNGIDTQEND